MFNAPFIPPKPKPGPTLRERTESIAFGAFAGFVVALVAWIVCGSSDWLWFIPTGGFVGFTLSDRIRPTVLW